MRRVTLLATASLFASACSTQPESSGPSVPRGARSSFFVAADVGGNVDIQPAVALRGASRVNVVIVMQGDPVGVVAAAAPTPVVFDRAAAAANLAAKQQPIVDAVRARGGQVLATFQYAINGVKARVAARDLATLRALPGVVDVRPVTLMKPDAESPDNAVSVPFIGAPAVWGSAGAFTGARVKVAIIDTGIDYTHANFGGPGTPAAYTAAHANEALPPDPALFGPGAPKVKGGVDLVGDAYDAGADEGSPALIPHPDPNPLDCNGHGSHVAGTTAGLGVLGDGSTYHGPYNALTVSANSWRIGPGVAPNADLYAVRVFGCAGSTDVTVDAIDWAVAHGMQVINMSLGSSYGTANDASALAAENAAKAGILVVASAGNAGANPYLVGSPSTGDRVISVAAMDSTPTFPGAVLTLVPSGDVTTQIDNDVTTLPAGPLDVVVLRNSDGTVSLGCNAAEYSGTAGKVVVTMRGTCARVDRATFGQAAGAAAVIMINTDSASYGVFEGNIPGVHIPFLGAKFSSSAALAAATTVTTLTNIDLANPGFPRVASFSSGGVRSGDSALKPTLTAPGVSTLSTAVGTGNQGERLSGTSMASPHVAGVAALVVEAHPGWTAEALRGAIVSTTAIGTGKLLGYSVRLNGAGLVQADGAAFTRAVVLAQPKGSLNVSFGFKELKSDYAGQQTFVVRNLGASAITFAVAATKTAGTHGVTVPSTVTVGPGADVEVPLAISVPLASVGNTDAFRQIAGRITLTPTPGSANNGVQLSVPYYLVPRARSNLAAQVPGKFGPTVSSATAQVTNQGALPVNADFYAWGPSGARNPALGSANLRAVGVQAFPGFMVFAIDTFERFSSPSTLEFDIFVDTNGDGTPEYDVFGLDLGLLQTGDFTGQYAAGVLDLSTGVARVRFLAAAPTDGSTILLPIDPADLGLTPANPRFTYFVQSFDLFSGAADQTVDAGRFNAFTPAVENGQFASVAPGATVAVPVAIDKAEWAKTPPAGLMIVNLEGTAGDGQASLVKAR